MESPTTLIDAVTYFSNPQNAFDYLVNARWPDGKVICPHCESERLSFLKTRLTWKCLDCKKQFSVKSGTVFENSIFPFLNGWSPLGLSRMRRMVYRPVKSLARLA